MAVSISIHSHKGGSGKTLVSMNLASLLAKYGKTVAIMDLDLSAPSLQTYAPGRTEKKVNDLLMNSAKPEEIFFDATYLIGDVSGKVYMALSDEDSAAIARINQRDQDALLNDLFILMELIRNQLTGDPWNVDYIIIDTSPGLTTQAINGVAVTDQVVMLLRLVNADAEGTRHFLETLHKSVQPKAHLIVNQIPEKFVQSGGREQIRNLVQKRIIDMLPNAEIQLSGILETDENIISNELAYAFNFLNNPEVIPPRPIHVQLDNAQSFVVKFDAIVRSIIGE